MGRVRSSDGPTLSTAHLNSRCLLESFSWREAIAPNYTIALHKQIMQAPIHLLSLIIENREVEEVELLRETAVTYPHSNTYCPSNLNSPTGNLLTRDVNCALFDSVSFSLMRDIVVGKSPMTVTWNKSTGLSLWISN